MENDVVIKVENLSKMYKLYERPLDRIKEMLIPGKKVRHKEFYAVNNLSFEVRKGEVMGIIGINGSGKSTLLKMITGVLTPTAGRIEVKGRIAALLELGAGFNPEFTGIENIFLQGTIMGFSREEMAKKVDEIVAFADIGDFIDQPVKTYSSGMFVRLAFAVNSCVEPEIMIIDEALSVGDFYFVQKCYRKIEETIQKGTAVIFVTHNMADMVKFCNQAILMSHGKCLYKDDPVYIMQKYFSLQRAGGEASAETGTLKARNFGEIKGWPDQSCFSSVEGALIEGNGKVSCQGVALLNQKGIPVESFESGDTAVFYYEYLVLEDMDVPIFGIDIIDSKNNILHGKQSLHCGTMAPGPQAAGTILRCRQEIQLDIAPGMYTTVIGMAMLREDIYSLADEMSYPELCSHMERVISISKLLLLQVTSRKKGMEISFHGMVDLPGNCEIQTIAK